MRRTLVLALTCLLLAGAAEGPRAPEPPVSVFAGLDGTWTGTFVGYDEAGRELYRIAVRQVYETVDDERQTVEIRDTMADGTVITGRGENRAWRDAEGRLQLRCLVAKSNGDQVEHRGRVNRDPDGLEQIVWYSNAPDRVETFREVVREDSYEINGMGRYGASSVLMSGRYVRETSKRQNVETSK